MNVRAVAEALCRRLHPAEWEAPVPRQQPCADCVGHAAALLKASVAVLAIPRDTPPPGSIRVGPIMHVEPPPPRIVPVAARCPRCGYGPTRSYA